MSRLNKSVRNRGGEEEEAGWETVAGSLIQVIPHDWLSWPVGSLHYLVNTVS